MVRGFIIGWIIFFTILVLIFYRLILSRFKRLFLVLLLAFIIFLHFLEAFLAVYVIFTLSAILDSASLAKVLPFLIPLPISLLTPLTLLPLPLLHTSDPGPSSKPQAPPPT